MYRKMFGGGKKGKAYKGGEGGGGCGAGKGSLAGQEGCTENLEVPKALLNRAKHGRRRRHSAPTVRLCKEYGPPPKTSAWDLDKKILIRMLPWLVRDIEENDKEKEKENEDARISEEEAEKLPELTVKKVSFLMRGHCGGGGGGRGGGAQAEAKGNAKRHHTDKYSCNKKKEGQPVLRRGQEFRIKIVFDRPYNKEQDDLTFRMEADDNPGKGLLVDFKMDEERKKPFDHLPHWAARLKKLNPKACAIRVSIYIPPTCVVGEWRLKIKTRLRDKPASYMYVHDTRFIVLFNPWCKHDQVYFSEDPKYLQEYVLNGYGTSYYGASNYVQAKPWTYGQFQDGIVQICLSLLRKSFGFRMCDAMGDPVIVSRNLSKIVNSADEGGVLTGNWSGNYEGGQRPTYWKDSSEILRQYAETLSPVNFGQCWVFSQLLTAVCRALGLPCRSVTNFDSAHDTDSSCTIDCYYDENGSELKSMKTDSIWNFHVWNEVYIRRPELCDLDVDGWHVIDATPQEQSDGIYQCGPCPVKAVKQGLVYVPYETRFVVSEVNADIVHWVCGDDGQFTPSAYKKKSVGAKISTKPPDGKPFAGNLNFFNQDDVNLRCDLTGDYKAQEGSVEERASVRRAVRQSERGDRLYEETAELEVEVESVGEGAKLGEDVRVAAVVKNVSQADKEVEILFSARTCCYWNDADQNKELVKEKPKVVKIKAGAEVRSELRVPGDLCLEKCDGEYTVYVYARAKDVAKNMPYTAQQPFKMAVPDLEIKGPSKAKANTEVVLTVILTNPLDTELTNCVISSEGDLSMSDNTDWECVFWWAQKDLPNMKPRETRKVEARVKWWAEEKEDDEDSDEDDEEEDEASGAADEPEEEFKTQTFTLSCRQLDVSLVGTYVLTCDTA